MRDVHYTPTGTRKAAMTVAALLLSLGVVFIYPLQQHLGPGVIWQTLLLLSWCGGIVVWVRYVATSYTYTLTEEVTGIPTLCITRITGGRIIPCRRIPLGAVTELCTLSAAERTPTPAKRERILSYTVSLGRAERQILRVEQEGETLWILLEGSEAFYFYLENAIQAARANAKQKSPMQQHGGFLRDTGCA